MYLTINVMLYKSTHPELLIRNSHRAIPVHLCLYIVTTDVQVTKTLLLR